MPQVGLVSLSSMPASWILGIILHSTEFHSCLSQLTLKTTLAFSPRFWNCLFQSQLTIYTPNRLFPVFILFHLCTVWYYHMYCPWSVLIWFPWGTLSLYLLLFGLFNWFFNFQFPTDSKWTSWDTCFYSSKTPVCVSSPSVYTLLISSL